MQILPARKIGGLTGLGQVCLSSRLRAFLRAEDVYTQIGTGLIVFACMTGS